MKKINLLIICMGVVLHTIVNAQTAGNRWALGVRAGIYEYNGNLGNDFFKFKNPFVAPAGSLSYYINRNVDFEALVSGGILSHGAKTDKDYFNGHLFNIATYAKFKLYNGKILSENAIIGPYLFLGFGDARFKNGFNNTMDFNFPMGAGLRIRMGERTSINIQSMYFYSLSDVYDNAVSPRYNVGDNYLYHSAGLVFNFGFKDTDKDGIYDRKDKCPGTPEKVKVDVNGCPLDKDKDGVADYMDDCMDLAGVSALKGCPDKDNDGIADKDDKCPDVAGKAELKGCADSDNDGIADGDDKCANTDKKYKVDATGCPLDNDKDGVFNEDDKCPDLTGVVALQGCPDKDSDGVADAEDRCPDAKGTIANKGCPEIAKEDVQKIVVIANKIFFETGSDKLKATSTAQLNSLVDILKKYDAVNLEIHGHTDNVGKDEKNMELSQKRTESVKKFLVSKGIAESRLTAKGFGETQPIADNKTAAGRSKNRRVELKTSY